MEKKYIHPDSKLGSFTQLPFNDIAVLKLDREVPIGESISPACLPGPGDRLKEGDTVTASGFGFIEGSSYDFLKYEALEKFLS